MPLFSGRFTTKKVQSPVKDNGTNDTPSSPPKEESKPISDTPTKEDDPAVNNNNTDNTVNTDEARTLTHHEETGLWVVTEKANDSSKEEEYDSSPTKSPTKTVREKNSTSRFHLEDDNKDKQRITNLEDENRLLKLKMEVLIDMINDLLTN